MKTTTQLQGSRFKVHRARVWTLDFGLWTLGVRGCLVGFLIFVSASTRASSVVNTVHNLSATGPGSIKAVDEKNTCVFCHTVHKTSGQTPLWSHGMSSVSNYIVYSSPTLKATVGQPDGSSRLCLSCHDGTVALGLVSCRTTPIRMQGGVTTMPASASNLGTDLSGDHPISFVYDQNLAQLDQHLKDPSTLDKKIRLDHNQKLQCATCHNPHDDQYGNFLVMDNTGSALCLSCHTDPAWPGSSHSMSSASPAALVKMSLGPAPKVVTVASLACASCHVPHKAGSRARLLINAREEQNCFSCHNGNVVQKNLAPEFNKASVHPVLQTSTEHSLAEDPVNSARHTACADCHNAHAANNTSALAPNSPGAIAGVQGLTAGGATINEAVHEYELCFRCHADSVNRGPAQVTRLVPETNKRIQFSPANQSFHPVETIGKNPNVPSLIAPWTTASVMYCTDCHNNDQGPRAGGTGPGGPHGSAFAPLLERRLVLTDLTGESAANYALCYKCHSRDSILSDQSFKSHRKHIVEDQTACTTCHDSHGVAANDRLINFNLNYVSPAGNFPIQFVPGGASGPTCVLKCHDHDHLPGPATPLRSLRSR